MLQRKLFPILLSLGLTILFLLIPLRGIQPRILQHLSNFAYDTRLRLTMPKTVDPRIVIRPDIQPRHNTQAQRSVRSWVAAHSPDAPVCAEEVPAHPDPYPDN